MKAKDLAAYLLKYQDFDVEFDICTHDRPWPEYQSYRISGIDGVADISKVIIVEVEEVKDE